ncbi:ParB/RepB/Spo0J family partition protein [Inmirania thermothiophila]|uniref:Probable chromosome-partitioning protein ParB n=1 Tax=Inmirania thermothiophila TaxID=1750597 RepID=A0A3N1Y739_9GAMM|nr:ParB/RepB/Spo0J family partition protein [Inmirania thermothiophila]ROR34338.1 ParB family chromosome partitioning protein [Inmirania thermothiophila]
MARRRLGRGLDALLGATGAAVAEPQPGERLRSLPLDRIRPSPFQPRRAFDPAALEELAASIRAQGVVQPVVVRPAPGGEGYELVAGERRWRAAQMAGLAEVPAVVREVDDRAAMAMALIENVQREDLNPLEEALALRRLVDEFGLTHQEAAEAVGRSRAAVSNLLRLLELHEAVKALLAQGALEMGHARAIAGLPPARQPEAAREVVRRGLSVRETERLVRRMLAPPRPAPRPDPDVDRLQRELSERLGARVELKGGGRRGRLVIHYTSVEELEGILERLR